MKVCFEEFFSSIHWKCSNVRKTSPLLSEESPGVPDWDLYLNIFTPFRIFFKRLRSLKGEMTESDKVEKPFIYILKLFLIFKVRQNYPRVIY